MTFDPLKPGGYSVGERLTAAQMDQLNDDIVNAVDGAAGGTYAPSSAIVIGGSGLETTVAPTGGNDVTNKTYVDAQVGTKVVPGAAHYTVETAATGAYQNLTQVSADSGFTISGGNRVQVPAVGKYLVIWKAKMVSDSTNANPELSLNLLVNSGGSAVTFDATETRFSSTATVYVNCGDTVVVEVSDTGADLIGLTVASSDGTPSLSAAGRLTITRVSA